MVVTSLVALAKRDSVHAVLQGDCTDREAAREISVITGESIPEAEVSRYRRLTDPSFLRASPYPADTESLPSAPAPVRKKTPLPEWAGTPGCEVNGDEGVIYTRPRLVGAPDLRTVPDRGPEADAAELREFGFDPETWEVAWAKRGTWQAPDGTWLESRRLTVKKRDSARMKLENVNEIFAAYASLPKAEALSSSRTVVLALGDLQAGKVDGGGSESLVVRFARIMAEIAAFIRDTGGCERLILIWAGDCTEGVVSQGGRLVTRLDLSVTEQVRLVSRMIMHEVGMLAPLCNRMLILTVPGNHDESHRIAATKPSDSWAIQAASSVADALALMGGYEHVEWLFPGDEELALTVSVGTEKQPFTIAVSHGHVPGKASQMIRWWADQGHGRQPAGEADLLITGHLHHLRVESTGGGKTWIQLPAMDGGSEWYRRKKGEDSPAGAITMELDPSQAPGWRDLRMWT